MLRSVFASSGLSVLWEIGTEALLDQTGKVSRLTTLVGSNYFEALKDRGLPGIHGRNRAKPKGAEARTKCSPGPAPDAPTWTPNA